MARLARGEIVEVAPEAEAKITDRMRGAYFGLVGEIIVFTQARNVREYRIERIYE